MAYRVELTFRATRDLEYLYVQINAVESSLARRWFDGLERALCSLEHAPHRCPAAPERKSTGRRLRHLLYGRRRRRYRAIFEIDEPRRVIYVLAIRHWAREEAGPEDLGLTEDRKIRPR